MTAPTSSFRSAMSHVGDLRVAPSPLHMLDVLIATDGRKPAGCRCWDAPAVERLPANVRRLPEPNGRSLGKHGNEQRVLCRCGREWRRPWGIRGRVPKCPTCRGTEAA